jgi:hypothetical protein
MFSLLHENDGTGRTVLLARSTLYAEIYIDLALGLAFLNSAHRTSNNTRPTQNTFIPDYIGHCTVLGSVLSECRRFGNVSKSFRAHRDR